MFHIPISQAMGKWNQILTLWYARFFTDLKDKIWKVWT